MLGQDSLQTLLIVEYFCRNENGTQVIGRHFVTHHELSDLEFVPTWTDPNTLADLCPYFVDAFQELKKGRRVLLHCDAGRDRTGAVSALFAAMAMEQPAPLGQREIDALACDYRKTSSLSPEKYGRVASFISDLVKAGGVTTFVAQRCQMDLATLQAGAAAFAN